MNIPEESRNSFGTYHFRMFRFIIIISETSLKTSSMVVPVSVLFNIPYEKLDEFILFL